jgi:hypothetical protein
MGASRLPGWIKDVIFSCLQRASVVAASELLHYAFRTYQFAFLRQDGEHRFAYDEETLSKVLGLAGFNEIKRDDFDPELDSEHRRVGSLFISARKPPITT